MNEPQPTRLSEEAPDPTIQPEGPTAQAPPFVAPTPTLLPRHVGLPPIGRQIGDFELVGILGAGSFARVYLARQVSLGRLVALKVSRNRGQEAQTLARLEHDHIVRVFSEAVDGELHLLCMQYVAGTTLESVIRTLAALPPEQRDGQAILDVIDARSQESTALDLAALRDRELLASLDHVEAVCWIGARLAEALAHAHHLGVVHRDIKPANVLMNRYGRPLLADFNVAGLIQEEDGTFGGTLAYMSPEHLEAFSQRGPVRSSAVDGRADVYSLGLLLYELYTGELAFGLPPDGPAHRQVEQMLAARRGPAPPLSDRVSAPPPLERVMARCLAPRAEDRHANAGELAADLDSCRELYRVQRDLPVERRLTRWALASPLWFALLLVPLPHVIATVVNILYNATHIISHLNSAQQAWFPWVVGAYNSIAYPVLMGILFRRAWPVFQAYGAVARPGAVDGAWVEEMRRRALTLPGWLRWLSRLGWLPGGLIFPLALDLLAGPLRWPFYLHFLVSFTLSGLIAVTYSVLLMELLVVRAIYPTLFADARHLHEKAREELKYEEAQLDYLQFLAVLIPLAGAALILFATPGELTGTGLQTFRVLVTALLGAGMLGLWLAWLVSMEIRRTLVALMGPRGRR